MWETLERAVRIELGGFGMLSLVLIVDKKYFSSLTLPEMRAVEKSVLP